MLDLDEMRQHWDEHNRKLDESIRLNKELLTAMKLNRTRTALQRFATFSGLGALVQFLAIGALGSFIYENITAPRFALPAGALDVFAIAILAVTIRQIVLALQIDYDKPIAMIQRQLEELKVLRIRYVQGILVMATLAWTPLFIVLLKGFWGLDAYKLFGAAYLVCNVLVGLAAIPIALWLFKKLHDRMGQSPFLRRLMNDIAGYNLKAATGFLASLSEFKEETPTK